MAWVVARLEEWWRDHWAFEARRQDARDVTWQERACSAPPVLALYDCALSVLRDLGYGAITAAPRAQWRPHPPGVTPRWSGALTLRFPWLTH
jgi:hypothetical protein